MTRTNQEAPLTSGSEDKKCGASFSAPSIVLMWCVAVGSAGRFRKVPESSGVCWCRFRRQVPEREASSGRFRKVPAKVPESLGVCWCRFRRQVPEGSGEFRCIMV